MIEKSERYSAYTFCIYCTISKVGIDVEFEVFFSSSGLCAGT